MEARAFRVLLRAGRVVRWPLKNKALDVESAFPSGFERGDRFLEAKQVRRVKKPKEEEAADSWVAVEGLCILDRWESVPAIAGEGE
ncbi:hypothetical protein F2Q70_00010294 [Brassica cretica]|uniref:Uncharacterized protein n=1 Tax=Brassica cretica TaxID=69181 RepID=A0A8S9LWU5_BRACR|nr:hypothetical protein F2Q70_00010294 [Brassica cretica]